jgi:hypothetical protein
MGHAKAESDKIEQLREATRQANEVLKDLRAERKAFQELVDSLGPHYDEFIAKIVTERIDAMVVAVETGMNSSVEKVFARFDKLEHLLLGGMSKDRRPLEEVAEAFVKKREEREKDGHFPKLI